MDFMAAIAPIAERMTGLTVWQMLSMAREERPEMREGDFLDVDGTIICGKCGMPRETLEYADDGTRIRRPIVHMHDIEMANAEVSIEAMRADCFSNYEKYADADFERCDSPLKSDMELYVSNFKELSDNGRGVIIYGEPGRGKTYLAACTLNALLKAKRRCKMTSIGYLMDPIELRDKKISRLKSYDCVCIDDYGSERGSAYGKESGYEVVNRLYAMGKPVIVTTNLTAEQLRRPPMEYVKTIERLKEKCDRLEYSGPNRRQGVLS